MDWDTALKRIARVAHNSFMEDDFDALPENGIERAAWGQVAVDVVKEMQSMMNEMPANRVR